MAKKYYAVKKGLTTGIYLNWEDCKAQIDGYPRAEYKGFNTIEEAETFLTGEAVVQPEYTSMENDRTDGGLSGKAVVAYVDGSYNKETKEYSAGVVILKDGIEAAVFSKKGEDESIASMRNVAGEILGARLAMEYAVENGFDSILIVHDYSGIAGWCVGGWKTNKEGTRAYKEYYESIKGKVNITFQSVKGHSGNKYNDMADALAKKAIGME